MFLFIAYFIVSIFTTPIWTLCASAFVTKSFSTSAFYWWAAWCSLNPIFATWTLFEFCTLYERKKSLIIFLLVDTHFELLTCHSIVIIGSASETIVICTYWALIISKRLIILENSRTSSSWTPWDFIFVIFNIFIELKFVILIHEIIIKK